ncbi:MAG: glycosyltransferase family 4 protein [Clostridiaceae bacterium]
MKICFFVGDISKKAGTERVTTIIANEMVTLGHKVYIMSLVDSPKAGFDLHESIVIIPLKHGSGNNKKNFIPLVNEIRKTVKKYGFDVLIEADVILRIFTIPACFGLSIPVVSWEHFNFNSNLGLKLRDYARILAARHSKYIVTLTETDRKSYMANLKCKAKVMAIENPLVFYPEEYTDCSKKVVLTVGRLNYQKGYDNLLDAWRIVHRKHPDWTLRIAGTGELEQQLKDQAKDLEIDKSVKFLGQISNVAEEYKNSNIYAMSSRFEGFPMVLLEAMSFGLPVVSFDCQTGPRDMIKDGEDGILVNPGDIKGLAEGINRLIENDSLRKTMSVNARNNIKRFSKENILNKWVQLFEAIDKN